MPYRSKALKPLMRNSTQPKTRHSIDSPFSSLPNDKKCEQNINAQIETIHSSTTFLAITTENGGLINPFTDKCASQKHDLLLNFQAIGEREFFAINIFSDNDTTKCTCTKTKTLLTDLF